MYHLKIIYIHISFLFIPASQNTTQPTDRQVDRQAETVVRQVDRDSDPTVIALLCVLTSVTLLVLGVLVCVRVYKVWQRKRMNSAATSGGHDVLEMVSSPT